MKYCPHGGRELERSESSGFWLDFSANINPWGPPEIVKDQWQHLFRYVSVYPPLDLGCCRQAIARLTGFPAETILPTNGAMQAIALLARRLPDGEYQVLEPLFTEYGRTFTLEGKRVTHRLVFPGDGDREMGHLFEDRGLQGLILGNPGNPSGTSFSPAFLDRAVEWSENTKACLVVDEAFQDFLEEKTSLASRISTSNRIFIVRSLTKYYALAGLRGGYLLAHPEVIESLEEYIEPWSVNAILSQVLRMLSDSDLTSFRETTRAQLHREQHYLQVAFSSWRRVVTLFLSQTNFFLARSPNDFPHLPSLLAGRGILVRETTDFWGLDRSFFRFSVRSHQDNEKLVEAMEECISGS